MHWCTTLSNPVLILVNPLSRATRFHTFVILRSLFFINSPPPFPPMSASTSFLLGLVWSRFDLIRFILGFSLRVEIQGGCNGWDFRTKLAAVFLQSVKDKNKNVQSRVWVRMVQKVREVHDRTYVNHINTHCSPHQEQMLTIANYRLLYVCLAKDIGNVPSKRTLVKHLTVLSKLL